jgi:phospholipase/carboxylesterase
MLKTIEIDSVKSPAKNSVILLHGLGSDGSDLASFARDLDFSGKSETRFICPDADLRPIGVMGGDSVRAWFDIDEFNLKELEADEAGIYASQALIEKLIAKEIERGISSEKIVLGGFSQGATMALHCGLRYQKPLAGIFAMSGFLALPKKLAKEKSVYAEKTPTLLLHGELDDLIPISLAQNSYQFLTEQKYNIKFCSYPTYHSVHFKEIEDIGKWLEVILGREGTTR